MVEENRQAFRRMPKRPMARMTAGAATPSCSDIHVVERGPGRAPASGRGTTRGRATIRGSSRGRISTAFSVPVEE